MFLNKKAIRLSIVSNKMRPHRVFLFQTTPMWDHKILEEISNNHITWTLYTIKQDPLFQLPANKRED